ncbi:MAG: carboxynorspermidine decarboxylase [Saprospiraceae bacterium]|nr:carboxynorspermidine decarboxylase [Saprospiraceae bacterium]
MSINYKEIASPAFVLDEALLIKNLELIQSVQERAGVSVILALKGFAMWRVFPLVGKYLKGATASSLNEAKLIYEEMGVKAHTYSPAYMPDEFEETLQLSSHITFNSISQYERFRSYLAKAKDQVSAGLRVNPEYSEVEVDLYNPSAPGSRLGIQDKYLVDGLPEGIEGLHFHVLCESSSYELEKVLVQFEKRFGHLLPHLKWVNFGGGHLMTRKDYDVEHLIKVLKAFKLRHPKLEVILEPGSAIAWQTGTLLATVLDIVESHGIHTAIVDVSFTAHMPDTLEMPYRPKIIGATDPVEGKPTYRIGGVSCLAGDYMNEYSFDQPLEVGQQLIFEDMIHYTMVKTTMFNGVRHPDICIWNTNGELEVVRSFRYEDFKNRLS